MSKLRARRITVNKTRVTADVTGAGEWLTGVVTEADRKRVTFQPEDGSDPVTVPREECFKPDTTAPTPVPVQQDLELDEDVVVELSDLESDEEESDEDEDDGSVRIRPKHERYTSFKDQPTKSGRASYDTSDFVAQTLRGLELDPIFVLAAAVLEQCQVEHIGRGRTKMPPTIESLHKRYDGLKNDGMKRMCLGNVIRGAYRSLGVDPAEEMAELLS